MKINNVLKALALSAVVFAGSACNDYPDAFVLADGKPIVHFVRYTDRDIAIEQAFMQESICIVGENLCSVHELYFNDQPAILNTSYMTENTLVCSVPKTMAKVKTNKMYLITAAKDTVTYDFKVMPPVPVVRSMTCEMVQPGSVTTIYGDYFISEVKPITVEFANGTVEQADFIDFTPSSITLRIPETAVEGKVKVSTDSGVAASGFHYLDSRGLLFDFDGKTGINDDTQSWHKRDKISDEWSISGTYVQLGNGVDGLDADASWKDGQYSFEYWCGSWDDPQKIDEGLGIALYNLVDFSKPSNMSLKFEMCIPAANPWKSGAMQIAFEGVDKVTISGNPVTGAKSVAGANAHIFNNDDQNETPMAHGGQWGRAIYRPWEATGSFDTNDEWITVTIPISDFKYDRNGKETQSWCPTKAEDFASLTMFVFGGGLSGAECAPIIKIDNIRAVPNK